jgi:hypothetical protein
MPEGSPGIREHPGWNPAASHPSLTLDDVRAAVAYGAELARGRVLDFPAETGQLRGEGRGRRSKSP